MKSITNLVVFALATRRLTSLITEDKITEDFRDSVEARFSPENKVSYLVTCRKCVSVWAGITLGLLTLTDNNRVSSVVYGLALSEAVNITDKFIPQEFNL